MRPFQLDDRSASRDVHDTNAMVRYSVLEGDVVDGEALPVLGEGEPDRVRLLAERDGGLPALCIEIKNLNLRVKAATRNSAGVEGESKCRGPLGCRVDPAQRLLEAPVAGIVGEQGLMLCGNDDSVGLPRDRGGTCHIAPKRDRGSWRVGPSAYGPTGKPGLVGAGLDRHKIACRQAVGDGPYKSALERCTAERDHLRGSDIAKNDTAVRDSRGHEPIVVADEIEGEHRAATYPPDCFLLAACGAP